MGISMSAPEDIPTSSALFLSAFFDELAHAGVEKVVISPGSRSTPLAMVAYESTLEEFVDLDERGAAFLALGMAKASKKPVCLICTSGTAAANYFPAILEASTSRVPLIVLTGDRPPHLQNLGAPQTTDQIKLYGDTVRHFQQMPLPGKEKRDIAFARQMARTAFIKSGAVSAADEAGPVHFNFPFEEPLKPNLAADGLFSIGRSELAKSLPPYAASAGSVDLTFIEQLLDFMADRRGVVLCAEGTADHVEDAHTLIAWAERFDLPLIADPLSNLRSYDHPLVIDSYNTLFGKDDCLPIDYVIRFGQYPVSKRCFVHLGTKRPLQIVVDPCDTRDFNSATDMFIKATPQEFISSFGKRTSHLQSDYAEQWIARNEESRHSIVEASQGSDWASNYLCLLELLPERSLLFAANSLAIRMIDSFYLKSNKQIDIMCNRGLNGIDGTVSSAIGAAQSYSQTTFFTGDLTLVHDINALALQQEILAEGRHRTIPSIIIVVFNNNGGGIFDMLPQKSEEDYFERLFATPQNIDFESLARGFNVPYYCCTDTHNAAQTYKDLLGTPGISLMEIPVTRDGMQERLKNIL